MPKKVICPTCHTSVQPVRGAYGWRYACCGLVGWNGKPLQSPATLFMRRRAHDVFDRLWQHGYMRRGTAYHWLAQQLGCPEPEAHMSVMNYNRARQTVFLAFNKLREFGDPWAAKMTVHEVLREARANPKVELTPL